IWTLARSPSTTRSTRSFTTMKSSASSRRSSLCTGRDNGQRERERRPFPDSTLPPDPPAVELDELSAERKTEPRAFCLPVGLTDLTELLEHELMVLGRDADPAVSDGDRNMTVRDPGADGDSPAFRSELDRVR